MRNSQLCFGGVGYVSSALGVCVFDRPVVCCFCVVPAWLVG